MSIPHTQYNVYYVCDFYIARAIFFNQVKYLMKSPLANTKEIVTYVDITPHSIRTIHECVCVCVWVHHAPVVRHFRCAIVLTCAQKQQIKCNRTVKFHNILPIIPEFSSFSSVALVFSSFFLNVCCRKNWRKRKRRSKFWVIIWNSYHVLSTESCKTN